MARINIEASAALSEWIDLFRADPSGPLYKQIVNRALCYLPMSTRTVKLVFSEFGALAVPETAARLIEATDVARLERARADVKQFPSRVFANALVNTAWRNGPLEDIDAGRSEARPLRQRRVTPEEERNLMHFASERMALGMAVCMQFATERPERRWPDQVLPYALASLALVTPSGWTLTEDSREIRLAAIAE